MPKNPADRFESGTLGKYALSRNFTLDLHFRHAHAPRGIAMIRPTASSWGTATPEVNIVAAMTPKYTGPPTGAIDVTPFIGKAPALAAGRSKIKGLLHHLPWQDMGAGEEAEADPEVIPF